MPTVRNRTDIRLPVLHCQRLCLYEDGFRIYPDWPSTDTVIPGDGSALTAREAEAILDSLDHLAAERERRNNLSGDT